MLIPTTGEDLCLAYANTLSWRGSTRPKEALHDFADLLAWAEHSAGMDPAAAQQMRRWSRDHHGKAGRLYAEAIQLREVLHRLFSALAVGKPVRERDYRALRTALLKAPPRRELARADGHYSWRVAPMRLSMPHLLAPVLWSAGDLVLKADERRIRRCANDECLWLFIDQSKNNTRRWCDMASCGNRAKARRHYARITRR